AHSAAERRAFTAQAALFAANRRDCAAQRARLPAQHREVPHGVEHGEHAVAPALGGCIERTIGSADAPQRPRAADRLRLQLETLDGTAALRLDDHAPRAA